MNHYESLLQKKYGISSGILAHIAACKKRLRQKTQEFERIRQYNALKVLQAFQDCGLAERHFNGSTGYGLTDDGKYKLSGDFLPKFLARRMR